MVLNTLSFLWFSQCSSRCKFVLTADTLHLSPCLGDNLFINAYMDSHLPLCVISFDIIEALVNLWSSHKPIELFALTSLLLNDLAMELMFVIVLLHLVEPVVPIH